MTVDIAALREEIDTPGVGSPAQLRRLAHKLLDELEAAQARIAELESKQEPVGIIKKDLDAAYSYASFFKMLPVGTKLYTAPPKPVVKLPEPHTHLIWIQAGRGPDDYWDDVEVSRSEKDKCCDGSDRYPVYSKWEIVELLKSADIIVEGE